MSFTARETSLHDGQPVRLYLFELGGNQRWAFCSAVWETPRRRATSRCETTRPGCAVAIMM